MNRIRIESGCIGLVVSVVVKDLWPEGKDLRSEEQADKDLSVYANWTTASILFAIKIK